MPTAALDLYYPLSFASLMPEWVLMAGGCLVLLLGNARSEGLRRSIPAWTLGTVIAALLVLKAPALFGAGWAPLSGGGVAFAPLDATWAFVRTSALILGVLIVLVAWSQPTESERGEFFSMLLFSLSGLLLVGSAADLVILFMALELVSIPGYVMVALSRTRTQSLEAGTKYFYLGALSAAIIAYGFSFLYGVAGTTQLDGAVSGVAAALADTSSAGALRHNLAIVGVVLSFSGLLFKISAVPLHWYVADVYEGAASSVAGFLGFVPKLAGMVAIIRVVELASWDNLQGGLYWMIWLVAALSMTVGNVLALRQSNIKRLLAYSGIAHAGYMLVGVLVGPLSGAGIDGLAAVLFYAVIYGIANLGAFAVLSILRLRGRPCETVRDVAGLLREAPAAALLMALAMFTLMGLPPTPGFWGKLSLFGSGLSLAQTPLLDESLRTWTVTLVIIALLNSALAAAYYLRVIAAVLLYENDRPAEPAPREAQQMGAVLCGMLLLIFSFYPNVLLQAGRSGAPEESGVQAPTAQEAPLGRAAPLAVAAEPDPSRRVLAPVRRAQDGPARITGQAP